MEREIKTINAVVIGGMNMDICGKPSGAFRMGDSNLGAVSLKPGGVGRNIAHNLCLLGAEVSLVSAVGNDLYGRSLKSYCDELGMDTHMVAVLDGCSTSTYLYVTDAEGDMVVAINDMDISRRIDPEYLKGHMDEINRADAVVVDANLSEEAIAYIADNCTAPLFADSVSAAKTKRLIPLFKKLEGLKPNAMEAHELTGCEKAEFAAKVLLDMGIKRVFISEGAEGMLAASGEEMVIQPRLSAKVVNTTGAGDSATAAMVWAIAQGMSLAQCAKAAAAAGAITVGSEYTNAPELSAKKVLELMEEN